MMHPASTAAAQHVAATVAHHQRASEGLAEAEAARGTVAERLAALDGDRAAIIARHRAGTGKPDDAGRIALLDSDRADLASMLADADAVVAAARVPVQQASADLAVARQNLAQAEAELAEAALIEHASKLDALLHQTVTQINDLRGQLGRHQPVWAPSNELWGVLRRIQAQRGAL